MWFLLACSGTGTWSLTIDPPETDCVVEPEALDGTVRLAYEADQVHVDPLDDVCPLSDGRFACELAPWDARSDLTSLSLDAITTVDLDLSGGIEAGALSGTIDLVTTCVGADCAAVTGGPERCASHWTYTGVRQ